MVEKIISGGQSGADRAALDVAITFNIAHGGWVPKGRKAEDGPLPDIYQVTEMASSGYTDRTRQNVRDAHGTLVVSYGKLSGGSKLTWEFAAQINKPVCHIDLLTTEAFEAAIVSKAFVQNNQIQVLNVAGPRLSRFPDIYLDVKIVLETMLYLLFLDTDQEEEIKKHVPASALGRQHFPETIEQAVQVLVEDLPMKTKAFIARFKPSEIYKLYFVMLEYIRHRVGFDSTNTLLFDQCAKILRSDTPTVEDSVLVILKQLKSTLEAEYLLKVVK